MARVYKKPVMVVEQFVANEYVAGCTKVKVQCNIGTMGTLYTPNNGGEYKYWRQCDKWFDVEKSVLEANSNGKYYAGGVEQDRVPGYNLKVAYYWTDSSVPHHVHATKVVKTPDQYEKALS